VLADAIRRAVAKNSRRESKSHDAHLRGMERLVGVMQELSLARDLRASWPCAARGAGVDRADGATFVLRDGDLCHMRQEAIAPLWKAGVFR